MKETVRLRITTLTPVSIGSGAILSPYADYIIDESNKQICFVDKQKLQQIIAQDDRWLDAYVQGIATGMDNNRSDFDLKSFLLNNRIVRDIDEVVAYRCNAVFSLKGKLQIQAISKSPLQEPYFPGSTIKGALKTVLMYDWLKNKGQEADRLIQSIIDDNRKDFKELESKFSETLAQVTDSRYLNRGDNIVVDCDRKMPLRIECIGRGLSTEFELTLTDCQWSALAKQANNYAWDCIDRELDVVEDKKDYLKYFNRMVDIQDNIHARLKDNEGVAYLRVGFGKGYYLNSVGKAIYDYVQGQSDTVYNRWEDFINDQFARKDRFGNKQFIPLEEFPRTRLMVKATQEPLGWIKIEKI